MLKVIIKSNCHELNTFEQIQSEFLFKDGQNFLIYVCTELKKTGACAYHPHFPHYIDV